MSVTLAMVVVNIPAQILLAALIAPVKKDISWMLMGLLVLVSVPVVHVCNHNSCSFIIVLPLPYKTYSAISKLVCLTNSCRH